MFYTHKHIIMGYICIYIYYPQHAHIHTKSDRGEAWVYELKEQVVITGKRASVRQNFIQL